ncbi:MAG: hypothetical protein ACRC7D_10665 [Aeromonas popoffii]|uniref:hypothetical protein n=1 Tax=Aeromonas popoffii TaxID=70856 RepID=UPI003F2E7F31
MKLTRAALLLLSMMGLYACGGGDGDTGQDPGITPPAASGSVREALLKMDADGAAPKLNRDADVAGPDVDGNGVRDDLDAYINSLPDTELQKKALRQGYRVMRSLLLLDTMDTTAVLDGMRSSNAAIWCIYSRYDSDAKEKSGDIEKYSVNTEERYKAYALFNSAASGHSAVMPRGNGCDE